MLVAAVILGVGLLGALEAIGQSAATSRRVQDQSRALLFARSKLEEILKQPVLEVGTDQERLSRCLAVSSIEDRPPASTL